MSTPTDSDHPLSSRLLERRDFLRIGAITAAATAIDGFGSAVASAHTTNAASRLTQQASFELDEITITALQDGMRSGRWTARSIRSTNA